MLPLNNIWAPDHRKSNMQSPGRLYWAHKTLFSVQRGRLLCCLCTPQQQEWRPESEKRSGPCLHTCTPCSGWEAAGRLFVHIGMSEVSVTLTRQISNWLRQVGFLSGSPFWAAEMRPGFFLFIFFYFCPSPLYRFVFSLFSRGGWLNSLASPLVAVVSSPNCSQWRRQLQTYKQAERRLAQALE